MFEDLSRRDIDDQSAIIQMLDSKLSAAECSEEVHLCFIDKIIILALETIMRLLLDDNDDIPRRNPWRLVALSVERDGLSTLHALVDMHLQNLLLLDRLLSAAMLALVLVVDDLAGSIAVIARLLKLLHHGTNLTERDLDTLTLAVRALFYSTLLSATTVAFLADATASESKFCCLSLVNIF